MILDVYLVRCKCKGSLGVGLLGAPGGDLSLDATMWRRYPCLACGRYFWIERIVGRVSEHVCGAKCMTATGPSCECSCGGKNHGSAYA